MACPYIEDLKVRVKDLEAQFLADQLERARASPLDFVPNIKEIAAYRLLVHAELEDYLETKAKDGVDRFRKDFNAGKTAIRDNWQVLIIARYLKIELDCDPTKWPIQVENVLNQADTWISKNNGIKDDSFTTISVLSGKLPDEIDSVLSANLTSFGTKRGDVAHKAVHRVRTILSAADEALAAENILAGLERHFA